MTLDKIKIANYYMYMEIDRSKKNFKRTLIYYHNLIHIYAPLNLQ